MSKGALVMFFVLAYLISWLLWLPLYAPALGFSRLPAVPFQHILGAYGPLIAAAITTFIFNKKGVLGLLYANFKIGNKWLLLVSIFAPFLLALLSVAFTHFVSNTPEALSFSFATTDFGTQNLVAFVLLNLVTFGVGEETGWRGLALPLLQKRYSPLMSSFIITAFWAAWHLPLFLYRPGYMHMDVGGITGWFFSLLTGSVLLTWLYNSSGGSVLACAIFHATVDVVFTYPGLHSTTISAMGALITVWGIITAYHLYKRWRKPLSAKPNLKNA